MTCHGVVVYGLIQVHPTLSQANRLKINYSNRDLREMSRISRMLSDSKAFDTNRKWTAKYRNIWRNWLETRGPDIVILFHKETQNRRQD